MTQCNNPISGSPQPTLRSPPPPYCHLPAPLYQPSISTGSISTLSEQGSVFLPRDILLYLMEAMEDNCWNFFTPLSSAPDWCKRIFCRKKLWFCPSPPFEITTILQVECFLHFYQTQVRSLSCLVTQWVSVSFANLVDVSIIFVKAVVTNMNLSRLIRGTVEVVT